MNRIDIHQHVFDESEIEPVAAACQRLGIVKSVLLGLNPALMPESNDMTLAAARRFPDLFIPFAGFDLDTMAAGKMVEYRDQGFRGFKFIAPQRPYNDPAYLPTYERLCDLRLPALFHTGIIANKPRWSRVNSDHMRPIYLEAIARRLPELTVIGAHLGNPWFEEAAMACRWNPNLYFDLSGSTLKAKSPRFLGDLLWWRSESRPYGSPEGTGAWDKILFGTDLAAAYMEDSVADYDALMEALRMTPAQRRKIYHDTAQRLLGLSE